MGDPPVVADAVHESCTELAAGVGEATVGAAGIVIKLVDNSFDATDVAAELISFTVK
jgi:hypothetical protein